MEGSRQQRPREGPGDGVNSLREGNSGNDNYNPSSPKGEQPNEWLLKPDLDAAQRFLTLLDEQAERFTFQTFDDNRDRDNGRLARILHGALREHAGELIRLNNLGAGIFVMVQEDNGEGRTNENVIRIRAVFQEDDGEGKPLPLEPHIVNESSLGKHHRYLLVENLSAEEFRSTQERLIRDYGSDPSAKDPARVLRLPRLLSPES